MIGTILNVAGILCGGTAGWLKKNFLSAAVQNYAKLLLGLLTIFCGLRLTWTALNGSLPQMAKQLLVVILSLGLGKWTGRLLHLQKASNRIGRFARERLAAAEPGKPGRLADGFVVCAALFCAAPLGWLGAVHDGVSGYFWPLAIKAAMDGLATAGFVGIFGPGVILSAVPLLVCQGTLNLVCQRWVAPALLAHHLADPLNATGGLLIFCVGLLVLEVRKIEVTDYLPSLIYAPLLARCWP